MTAVQNGAQIVASSSVLSSGVASADHLTPDGLMLYLETRLDSIDSQINGAFDKQKKIEAIRKQLTRIQTALGAMGSEGGKLKDAQLKELKQALNELDKLDPSFAHALREDLKDAGVYKMGQKEGGKKGEQEANWAEDYTPEMSAAVGDVIGSRLKQLESSASLEMIQLQQLMSARQTAISLATNLVAALGKGEEAIVGNIGR